MASGAEESPSYLLSSLLPVRGLRALVSGSKLRYQADGFDLDLCYLSPQLLALGLPASGVIEPLYRNPRSGVRRRCGGARGEWVDATRAGGCLHTRAHLGPSLDCDLSRRWVGILRAEGWTQSL